MNTAIKIKWPEVWFVFLSVILSNLVYPIPRVFFFTELLLFYFTNSAFCFTVPCNFIMSLRLTLKRFLELAGAITAYLTSLIQMKVLTKAPKLLGKGACFQRIPQRGEDLWDVGPRWSRISESSLKGGRVLVGEDDGEHQKQVHR